MAAQIINTHRESVDITRGDADYKKKSIQMLEELGLPKGLFLLENIEEFGYNRNVGFILFIQKKKIEHIFKKIKQVVSYATEVTVFVEKGKVKTITGIKTEELFHWLSVVEVYNNETSKQKFIFKTGTELSESFDVSAFEI